MGHYKRNRCGCGHPFAEHRGRFDRGSATSCDACLFCDEYHARPVPLTFVSAADLLAPDEEVAP